jgi:FixJ family two-component response regulator
MATKEPEPTVHVVDDDPDMRDSLHWLLKTVGLRAALYESADDFLARFKANGPGCLVFDVRMPGGSGIDLYELLMARGEGMPVIFITAYADVPMAIRALKSGAVEFVEKPFNRQALLDRVQRSIRDDVARRRRLSDREAVAQRFRALTDKEREVLTMIKDGHPNKAISSALGLTTRAVEMRRSALMKKLSVRSLADLLRLTFEQELASQEETTGR